MTRVEAEMAIVREARLLQSTGALPQFDLGKLDSAEAVTSITFWTASDPAVANQEFYYWEGQITNPRTGDSYNLVIDDDLGKAYFLDIPYRMKIDAPDETGPAAADAFAKYHEVSVGDLLNVGYYDIYIDFLYATDNTDYQVLVEMDESQERFKMILKPSDII